MILRLAATILLLALLAACAPARDAAVPAAPETVAHEDSPPKAPDVSPTRPGKTKPGAAQTPGTVDYSCTTDAQCTVKDVGNCCGYYPACVNVDSPTFPEQVKAACAESGMAGICGFPSISACQCVEGRCESVSGPIRFDPDQTK